ncbi:sepiapterin reductase-like isoform X2 [Panulirus ornatus]|uniref:sepiapterin reductase-like isoform X2 n=1 Tax=Panulirus ornatus TaxID=150431 RepID=UPI003A85C83F
MLRRCPSMSIESKAASWGLSWVVVTGASQGLGAAICQGLAGRLAAGSRILGMARSAQGLQDTGDLVQKVNPDVKFIPHVVDFETASREDLKKIIGGSLKVENDPLPSRSVIFHNVGSVGPLDYLQNLKDQDTVNHYFQLNISSVVVLNAVFLEIMSQHPDIAVEVINISSLCGVQPLKSWGLYCAGKAARDMIFKVLAEEEPNILVLNYAPGPLDNNMQISE